MYKSFSATVCVLAIVFLASCSASNDSSYFLTTAAQGGMSEVQLGSLAVQRGGSDAVKQFGQHMIDDHTRANSELLQLASRRGIKITAEVNSKQKALAEKLSKLSGAEFDKEYMRVMVEDHKEDVAAFQKQSQEGTDADVREFAAKTLPTLQQHLAMAQQVAGNTK